MKIRDAKVHPTRQNKNMELPEYLTPDLPAASTEQPIGKTLFNPEYVSIARVMVEAGLKYSDLARAFNVDRKTIKNWMKQYPMFGDAIVEAQDWFNTQLIEKALVRRATGYDYNEDTLELTQTGRKIFDIVTGLEMSEDQYAEIIADEGARKAKAHVRIEPIKGLILTKRVKKTVAASERAIEYYLNNRSRFTPDREGNSRWAHTNKLEVTGAGGKDLIPDSISPEKLLAELIMQQKKADEIVEAELIEAKQIGVAVGEDAHDETPPT